EARDTAQPDRQCGRIRSHKREKWGSGGMTAPLDAPESAQHAEPEAIARGRRDAASRSLTQIAWRRLRRDPVALGGGVFVALLILVAVFAPLLTHWFGHPPNQFHQDLIDPATQGVLK